MKTLKLSKRTSHTSLVSMLCCALLIGHSASAQQINPSEPVEDSKSRAQIWAVETGEVAGAANFCKIDPELVESYITRAQARIASEAHDEVELVVARISFSNIMNTSSISEPAEGCEDFNERFARESLRLD